MSFQNKIAVVTGAAAGIGAATARLFAREGAAVAVADLNADGAVEIADEITRTGGRAVPLTADCGVLVDVEHIVEGTVQKFGGIDFLINNAASQVYGTVEETELETWERVLRDNLTAPYLLAKYSLPHMRGRGGGAIVNIGSVLSVCAAPGAFAYVTTKHGVLGLTRSLAVDLAVDGIRVNCICPGVIDTPRVQREAQRQPDPDKVIRDFGKTKPLKRIGRPEEIADMVSYLCSEQASFITGGIYFADGGMSAALPGSLGDD